MMNITSGHLHTTEVKLLHNLATEIEYLNDKPILCEIGSLYGKSTIAMASALNNGLLYTIDSNVCNEFLSNLKEANVKQKVFVIAKRSDDAVEMVPKAIQLLFIDGAHDYHSVTKDYLNYEGKIEFGGYLLFHDACWTTYQEPFLLIKDRVFRNKSYNLVSMVGNTMIFKKEPNKLGWFRKWIICFMCELVSGKKRGLFKKCISWVCFRLKWV